MTELPIARDAGPDVARRRVELRVERLRSEGANTYADLSIRNSADFSLVKISVECTFFGRRNEALEDRQQTILSPTESPMLPGMVRTATIAAARSERDVHSVSCDVRAL